MYSSVGCNSWLQIYISGGESVYSPGMVEYRDQHSILMWEDPEEDEDEDVEGVWVEVHHIVRKQVYVFCGLRLR